MYDHGHNCMRHGYQPTSTCQHCLLQEQAIREDGFKQGYDAAFNRGFEACRETLRCMCEDFAGVAEECHDEPQRKAWVSLGDCVANLQPGPLGRERKPIADCGACAGSGWRNAMTVLCQRCGGSGKDVTVTVREQKGKR